MVCNGVMMPPQSEHLRCNENGAINCCCASRLEQGNRENFFRSITWAPLSFQNTFKSQFVIQCFHTRPFSGCPWLAPAMDLAGLLMRFHGWWHFPSLWLPVCIYVLYTCTGWCAHPWEVTDTYSMRSADSRQNVLPTSRAEQSQWGLKAPERAQRDSCEQSNALWLWITIGRGSERQNETPPRPEALKEVQHSYPYS